MTLRIGWDRHLTVKISLVSLMLAKEIWKSMYHLLHCSVSWQFWFWREKLLIFQDHVHGIVHPCAIKWGCVEYLSVDGCWLRMSSARFMLLDLIIFNKIHFFETNALMYLPVSLYLFWGCDTDWPFYGCMHYFNLFLLQTWGEWKTCSDTIWEKPRHLETTLARGWTQWSGEFCLVFFNTLLNTYDRFCL